MKKLTFLSLVMLSLCLCSCDDIVSESNTADEVLGEITEAQGQSRVWTRICEGESGDKCGYADVGGNMRIPIGKYLYLFTEEFIERAIVLKEGAGFVVINRQEEVLMEVFNFDNGPDQPAGGYFRIVGADGKVGYAKELDMTIAIEPTYTSAKPFENGYAAVCPNCSKEMMNEYEVVVGKWGIINAAGDMVVEPMYDWIEDIRANNTAIVQIGKDKKKIQL